MRHMYYRLDADKNVVEIDSDSPEAENIWRPENRRVAEDTIGHFWISTVFVPINHRFGSEGPPIVFETMVFDNSLKRPSGIGDLGESVYQDRCCTWAEAEEMHKHIVQMVKDGKIPEA